MEKTGKSNIDWISIEAGLRKKQAELECAKSTNDSRERLLGEYQDFDNLVESIDIYRNKLKVVSSRVIKENDSFRTGRLKYLSGTITEAIERIFPAKSLKAEVTCDFKRKNAVDLRLTDQNGNTSKPYVNNGKLMQYLISFASVSKIAESLGCHTLFVDEAFGVAAENKLSVIGELVQQKVDEGMQIILVSQNKALYADVPRREIRLKYDYENSRAVLDSIVDVGGEVK